MRTEIQFQYVLHLNRDELRVIGLALSGRPLREQEERLAQDLNLKLQEQRLSSLNEEIELVRKITEKVLGPT